MKQKESTDWNKLQMESFLSLNKSFASDFDPKDVVKQITQLKHQISDLGGKIKNNKVKNQYLCPKGCVPKEIWEEA